ncbi:uncharacterized protein LOC120079124 [Benincasa hispida]|uniref:uncharacterized protein LOC120079124 n=1 Tax=Benincasa hispida TaxID=102211 RepID=UPI0018FF871E|nr:uncharacterized protein LOC120079124 [Benincasa hispida]
MVLGTNSQPVQPEFSAKIPIYSDNPKFGYLTEEILKPVPGDPQERIWKEEDSLLRSVLINSMEPQIGRPLLYAATAKDIWDAYAKIEEADRVYDFLAGLNSKFDVVWSRILGQRLIPSLMEVCSEIRLEEDRSSTMNSPVITFTDTAAFATKFSSFDGDKKPTSVCEHYKKLWHIKDQCWKLYGRPPNSKRR